MSATLAFRSFVATGVLLSACSQSAETSHSSPFPSNSGASAGAGSSAHSPASGSGVGGTDVDLDADAPAAGSADLGAAGANSNPGAAGSGGLLGGSTPTPVTWKILTETQDSNVYVNVPSAASRGQDAAVAYVVSTSISSAESSNRVLLQRFAESGELLGSPSELSHDVDRRSNVTLASDGKQYAACWNTASEIHCSLIDEQGRAQSAPRMIAGQYGTIVAGASGWAIAYAGSDKRVRLQALTPELELNGSDVSLEVFAQPSSNADGPIFAATPSGYVVVGSDNEEGRNLSLLRLSADLKSVNYASPLGRNLWFSGQVVASDTRAAVSLGAAYGSFLLLLDAKTVTAELPISGGGKTGMDSALLLTEGGIGAACLDPGAGVRRRFFADGQDAEIGVGDRIANAALVGGPEEGSDSYQQLLLVGDQTLLVGRSRRYGALIGAPLRVAPIAFP